MKLDELKIVKAADTRWLSHHASVTSLLRTLPAVLRALSAEGQRDATAYGLHHQLSTYSFIAALHLLDDALLAVNRLSKAFQATDVDLSIIQPLVSSTKTRLKRLKDKTSAAFHAEVEEIISKISGEHEAEPEVHDEAQGADAVEGDEELDEPEAYYPNISTGTGEADRFDRTRLQFLQGMLDNLDQRFPSMEVIDTFSVLQPGELQQPVGDRLRILTDHYANTPLSISHADLEAEWEELVLFVSAHPSIRKASILEGVAQQLLQNESVVKLFPLIAKLFSRAVALPVCTADCERAFSAMNRVKTNLRSRLKTTTMEKLMIITLEGPDRAEFDFASASSRWAALKNRRIFSS